MSSTPSRSIAKSYTRGEEIANTASHGLGLLLAICGLPFLTSHAHHTGGTSAVVGAAVFGGSAILLYLASTLYHATTNPRFKAFFRLMDHACIYLLIAGTYTPIALGVLKGGWGWTVLGTIWTLALGGLMFKAFAGHRYPRVSTFIYLAMGWLALVIIHPLWKNMAPAGLTWLFGGGLAYSFGVIFYVLDGKVRFSHFIWHMFVLGGTTCHFFAVMLYSH